MDLLKLKSFEKDEIVNGSENKTTETWNMKLKIGSIKS